MPLNDALLKRLTETPGVPGREEQQREILREELSSLTGEVRTDFMGSVIGTKKGRDDVRVMIAAHTDEIGFLVKYIDDKGFLRLQTLGGHDPANMVSRVRVIITTANGETLRGALQPARKPPHLSKGEDQKPCRRPKSSTWTSVWEPTKSKKRCVSGITRRWIVPSKKSFTTVTWQRRWTTASGCS